MRRGESAGISFQYYLLLMPAYLPTYPPTHPHAFLPPHPDSCASINQPPPPSPFPYPHTPPPPLPCLPACSLAQLTWCSMDISGVRSIAVPSVGLWKVTPSSVIWEGGREGGT